MRYILISAFILSVTFHLAAQNKQLSSQKGQTSLGVGMGLPYGALGGRLMTNVADNFGIFAGVGYQVAGVGYNFGMQLSFDSPGHAEFYLSGMYGTNAATVVVGDSSYDKLFTGPSFGAGVKVNSLKREGNYWDFGLVVPIKSSDYSSQINRIKADPNISEITEPLPVLFVVAYNFKL